MVFVPGAPNVLAILWDQESRVLWHITENTHCFIVYVHDLTSSDKQALEHLINLIYFLAVPGQQLDSTSLETLHMNIRLTKEEMLVEAAALDEQFFLQHQLIIWKQSDFLDEPISIQGEIVIQ